MKKLIFSSAFLLLSFLFFNYQTVHAVSFENPRFDVDININKDSTFTVKETIVYKAYGNFHGLRRDIPLNNDQCLGSTTQLCGGFDLLVPLAVYELDGTQLRSDQYKFYEVGEQSSNYARFEREYYEDGKEVNGEEFSWIIEYKVYGGIEWLGNNPTFYWNTIPEDRNGFTTASNITIHFPVNVNKDNLTLYDSYPGEQVLSNGDTFQAKLRNISSIGNYTVFYSFDEGEITRPSTLDFVINNPQLSNEVFLDGIRIDTDNQGILDFIPSGTHELIISHIGYEDYRNNINFVSDETSYVVADLKPTFIMSMILFAHTIALIIGIALIPFSIIFIITYFLRKGKDKNMPKTIIPLFEPPTNVAPYLLGSLKDETVDRIDIIGSLIDLAYRGYVKIKEIDPKKNYKLIKLEGKDGDKGLNIIETEIMDAIFGSSNEIETKNLRTTFPLKYLSIENNIYNELVAKGYFNRSPKTVRNSYFGSGCFFAILSIFIFILPLIFVSGLMGYPVIVTLAIPLFVIGFGFAFLSKWMPSKTAKGSKVLADILGFKMYLHTAERFRLQNLGPEEFERYLSYAIVFGIEKEWAKKFDGIYAGSPDWYEGTSNNGVWNAVLISSLARNFSDSTSTNLTPVTSSSSASGGGWSGGGGGFSGGGGGGGSSGGW